MRIFILAALVMTVSWTAAAQSLKLMDTANIDPAVLKSDVYGAWDVVDKSGKKRCRISLKPETTIGGSEIDVAKGCEKTFPIMGEITAWRLYENWTIGFVDATRKLRISFSTPDARYVAEPETDGIFTILKR
jgi:hypothetical protein